MKELRKIEEGLVPVYETSTGQKVVYGSELYGCIGSKRQYADWIRGRISECDAVENEDYETFSQNSEKPSGGRPKTEYIIQLDMAKEMAMLERNEKGKQVRRYFIELEKKYKIAQELVAKQLQDMMQFMEQQTEILKRQETFNRMVMDKLESKLLERNVSMRSINHEYIFDELAIIKKRKKELYGLTEKVAELCDVPHTSILHQAYQAIEKNWTLYWIPINLCTVQRQGSQMPA